MTDYKKEFVHRIKILLKADPRSGVDDIAYEKEGEMEFIHIVFKGGSRKKINVTYNSNGANYKEIGRAVYGEGAIGEIRE